MLAFLTWFWSPLLQDIFHWEVSSAQYRSVLLQNSCPDTCPAGEGLQGCFPGLTACFVRVC